MCNSTCSAAPIHVAAARFTPASLTAVATRAKAPGSFSISMTRSNGVGSLLPRLSVALHFVTSAAGRCGKSASRISRSADICVALGAEH